MLILKNDIYVLHICLLYIYVCVLYKSKYTYNYSTIHSVHCTMYSVQYMYSIYCILYTVQSKIPTQDGIILKQTNTCVFTCLKFYQ